MARLDETIIKYSYGQFSKTYNGYNAARDVLKHFHLTFRKTWGDEWYNSIIDFKNYKKAIKILKKNDYVDMMKPNQVKIFQLIIETRDIDIAVNGEVGIK